MTTLISGTIAFVSIIIFIISIVPRNYHPVVGDMFAHINSGISNDPNESPNPFVAIYRVEEIKESKARSKVRIIRIDGEILVYERWEPIYNFGKYDFRLSHN